MKSLYRLLLALASASFFIASAHAQGTVTQHAYAIGKGPGVTGFTSLLCTSAQLAVGQSAADPVCHSLSGDATMDATGAVTLANGASTRTHLGLAIGTNVEAWDTDLDCLAGISSTGVIKRTGSGTCSAGTIALSDIAAGTQDTVIGYFGSTSASALAIGNCANALTYSTSTHTFGCNSSAGTGTVTSVAAGTGLSASPSPITSSGTISLSSARQTLPTHQVFLSGSGTYTTPANVLWIELDLVGGGSGGGAGNNSSTASTAGGNTCWNTSGAACTSPVYQAGGGQGSTNSAVGAGGTISGSGTCDWSVVGGQGTLGGFAVSGTINSPGGIGGSSSLGGAGAAGFSNTITSSAAAANSGSGGGGGGQNNAATALGGGGGSSGATCHVVINSPAATYTYAVGAGGAGNSSPGTGGGNGAAGAAGHIVVYEHYGS